ncbi:HU family DNA-binding protein [Falsirhodobacter deserti]|uniref:HU family DNA-binding protein n=1 Tax=Falsirhodobacter deserti TaxID=1365611 RepID=UPI000FE43995|nr:HU family DNA-binding protein [Falsirhodobacter deserti]
MVTKTTPRKKAAEPEATEAPAAKEPSITSKMPDLLDVVVEKTGQKRSSVKSAVDAFLAVMAERLGKGEDLMLPPLGKLRVVKQKEEGGPLTLRLRPHNPDAKSDKNAKESLAEADD